MSLAACPTCRSAVAPGAFACDTCGLVLSSAAPAGGGPPSAPAAVAAAPATATTAAPPLRPGQQLDEGRYVIDRPLSRGGMGALYLAHDTRAFKRPVVIKTLIEYYDAADPAEVQEARTRFLGEARILAGVKYPTFPQIFAYFQDGPHACIVMEYIEGEDLSRRLSRVADDGARLPGRPYPAETVARWGIDLCRMLEYLAARPPAVVHHDIKPANLVLDSHSQELFLVDFGTARRTGALAADSGAFGTPGYAPPEQYRGQGTPKSDVYALAATLYHLASDDDPAGHPLRFPQLRALGPLGKALGRALNPDPAKRDDAAELRAALEEIAEPAPAQPAAQARAPLSLLPPPVAIQAPDGQSISTWLGLASWCEQNWDAAVEWLHGDLLLAVRQDWKRPGVAAAIQRIADEHAGNADAALDAVLAALDPINFGRAEPRVTAPADLSVGHVIGKGRARLRLQNNGRRYARVRLTTAPPWRLSLPELALRPDAVANIEVRFESRRIRASLNPLASGSGVQALQGVVEVQPEGGRASKVQLYGTAHYTPLTTPIVIGAIVMVLVAVAFGLIAQLGGRPEPAAGATTPGPAQLAPTSPPIPIAGVAAASSRLDLGQPLAAFAIDDSGDALVSHEERRSVLVVTIEA